MKKLLAIVFALCFLICSCKGESKVLTSTQVMMNTVITITIYDSNEEVLNGAIELCKQYEKMFDRNNIESDVYKINMTSGEVEVNSQTIEIIKKAIIVSQKSEGAFDITVAPLVDLWNIAEAKIVPSKKAIELCLKNVDYSKIKIEGNKVALSVDTSIDLGGIAKGYIADKIRQYLIENGVKEAVINLGGNVFVIGEDDQEPYAVGVQKPFAKAGESFLTLLLNNKTVVTSGVYQRYFQKNGKLYHHIIDTKTGYPVDNGIYSVTVIADSSAVADGLSTACLSLGIEKGTELASEFGAEIIFYDEDGKIHFSSGLKVDYATTPPTVALVD